MNDQIKTHKLQAAQFGDKKKNWLKKAAEVAFKNTEEYIYDTCYT